MADPVLFNNAKKGQKKTKKAYLPLEDELLEDSDSSTLAATVAAACDNVVLFELIGMWGDADLLIGFGVPARKNKIILESL